MATVMVRRGLGARAHARRPADRGPAPWLGLALAASAAMWLAIGVTLALVA
ncbi:MAG: hypothetical protein WAS21_30460 [Geminicoccaceae bacterium]